jgi:hypothetical protein
VLSFFLVAGRTPVISEFIADPLFIKKVLVIHVNLASNVWFLGFLAALLLTLPERGAGAAAFWAAGAGVALLAVSGVIPGVQPILSNYVPVLEHPLFFAGLALFHGAVAAVVISVALGASAHARFRGVAVLPPEVLAGIRSAGAIFLLQLLVFALSVRVIPFEWDDAVYYDHLFWGAGHVFQFVCIALVISAWLLLLREVTGGPVLERKAARWLMALLFLPSLASVALAARGEADGTYYQGFVLIMRWLTWPAYAVFLLAAALGLYHQPGPRRLPAGRFRSSAFIGFVTSVVLVLAGIAFGVRISESTTLIPAHYHATIGSMTVAFMAATYLLLERFGYPLRGAWLRRLSSWQPALYGAGQLAFAVGFAKAGLYGLERKTFGREQVIRTTEQLFGLGIMGVGGVLAIAGGGLFLYIVAKAWTRGPTR